MGRKDGMQSLYQSLATLVVENVVSSEDALRHCSDAAEFESALKYAKSGMMRPVAASVG